MAEADIRKLRGIKEGFESSFCPPPLCHLRRKMLNVHIFSSLQI